MESDYYKILEVSPNASIEEIKKNYKTLAQIYHPDKHNHSNDEVKNMANKKFKDINEAHEILSNEIKRKEYNKKRQEEQKYHVKTQKEQKSHTKTQKEQKSHVKVQEEQKSHVKIQEEQLCDFKIHFYCRIDAKPDESVRSIRIFSNNHSHYEDFDIGKIIKDKKVLFSLGSFGYIDNHIVEFLEKKIMKMQSEINEHENVHKNIGFHEYKGQSIFLAYKGIGVESKYIGTLPLGEKGDMEGYAAGIKNIIVGTPALELAVILGLCGALMASIG